MIKTSVIVPVYNTAQYLKECFCSIFNQTQKEIEVIAINDGSTDNSLMILEEIKKEYPELIIYTQENKGLGDARNKGLELATGEFIYFIDSDDYLDPNALEICYQRAKQNQLDVVMFDAESFGDMGYEAESYDRSNIVNEQEVIFRGEEYAVKYWSKAYYPSAVLVYMSNLFIKKYKLKFLSSIYYEDNEFHCKMILQAERVMYIPKMLYKRRYRDASIMTSPFDKRHAEDFLKMVQAVNALTYAGKAGNILYELKIRLLRTLYNRCSSNMLLGNNSFTENFYKTTLTICGGEVADISSYYGLELLQGISNILNDEIISSQTRQKIRDRKKKILESLFEEIPIKWENRCVGIYGTGRNTERFLNVYRENVGEIRANLIFIDSVTLTGTKKYEGYDVFNINDIAHLKLECIVIASSKFEQQIFETITAKYRNRFKIIRLAGDLNF